MDAAIQDKVNVWLNGNFDQQTKDEIHRLQKESPDQLADAFYKDLEFGTGGLRGIMGVGTNRMNKYTVGMATQGYGNSGKQSFPNEQVKVAIAHDSRNNSRFFSPRQFLWGTRRPGSTARKESAGDFFPL